MLLAIDVHYSPQSAKTVGVFFTLEDASPQQVLTRVHEGEIPAYVPGAFYKRELPRILELLEAVALEPLEAIIVDGHVFVDNDKSPGLGGHLWEALDGKIPVIGVAKSTFKKNEQTVIPVLRGDSNQALFVSAIGMDAQKAADWIREMHGPYRIPSLLKELDRLTKEG